MTMERHENPAPAPDEAPDDGEIGELSEEDKASICAAIDATFARPARDKQARLKVELGPQIDAWIREQEAARLRERNIAPGGHAEPRNG